MNGDIKTGTIYLVLIMITLGAAGAQLTQGLFPDSEPSNAGRVVTPNYTSPNVNQSNLQLYTFGFITGAPTLLPTATPTIAPSPTPTPTFIPTLPPLASPSPSPTPTPSPTVNPTAIPSPTATPLPATPTPTATQTPTPALTQIFIPTRTPTPTPIPACPVDNIKPESCGDCIDFEALACDEEVCEDGSRKKRLHQDLSRKQYCIYIQHRNPALYDRKKNDPDCREACVAKPIVYLYPTEPTLTDVTVSIPGHIFISYPFYPDEGWQDVLAYPDGTLYYKSQKYPSLFFESDVDEVRPPKNGTVIPKSELQERLTYATTKLGLIGKEQEEFLEYWIPELEKLDSPYILFSILDPIEKERVDHVDISPKPDTFIAFIAYFKPLQTPEVELDPLILPENPPERKGFVAVEWGGTIDLEEKIK